MRTFIIKTQLTLIFFTLSSHIVNFSKPTLKLQQYLMFGNTGGGLVNM